MVLVRETKQAHPVLVANLLANAITGSIDKSGVRQDTVTSDVNEQ